MVLLDLLLPGADGIELLGQVPELSDLRVIFISAYGRDETVARALDSGAADYMVKPFSPTELAARVRAAETRSPSPPPNTSCCACSRRGAGRHLRDAAAPGLGEARERRREPGEIFPFAKNNVVVDGERNGIRGDFRNSEFAGATYSPDGRWLFVNVQNPGITFAVTGPWVGGRTAGTGRFTDDPLRPGVTPVRAVHFTELRERIDALREAAGLGRFRWTDPVLRAGTPVRFVHLAELRSALAAAYGAAGRPVPRWTDPSPTARTAPIRAVHVTELRAGVVALE